MPGLFSRFNRPKLSLADQQRYLMRGLELSQKLPPEEVEATLVRAGAPAELARSIAAEAVKRQRSEILRSVAMPPSAREDVNYYFLLGVAPTATSEQIRRAYRRKARQVHPDQHNQEFERDTWARLMTLVTDANDVLTDPTTRRAYDLVWRERSRRVAAANRRQGEPRGDWETRYRWTIADISTLEDEIAEILEAVGGATAAGDLASRAVRTVKEYEDAILQVRTESYSLPPQVDVFAEDVRREMQRKEKLVPPLRRLCEHLAVGVNATTAAAARTCAEALAVVQYRQHLFDIRASGMRTPGAGLTEPRDIISGGA